MIALWVVACALAPPEAEIFDPDGDGVSAETDCDNADGDVAPGLPETPYDGVDNDCDPSTADDDIDGDGSPGAEDCDDQDPARSPNSAEIALNGIDDDCDPDTSDAAMSLANAMLEGASPYSEAGTGLALPGDLNGDGHPDLLVGAHKDDAGGTDAGAVYLVFGPFSGARALDEGAVALTGAAGDEAGLASHGGLDITGDGRPDLVVSAHRESSLVGDGGGAAWILDAAAQSGPLAERATAVVMPESSWDRLGRSAMMSADATGDGRPDLVLGAPYWGEGSEDRGVVYLVPGPISAPQLQLSDERLIVGDVDGEEVGQTLALADLNGDGIEDIIVAVPPWDRARGTVAVVWGGAPIARGLSEVDLRFDGEYPGNEAGFRVAVLDDPSDSGAPKLVISARGAGEGNYDAGQLYIVGLDGTLTNADATILGESGQNGATALDASGDFDGDGRLDLAIGACEGQDIDGAVYLWRSAAELSGSLEITAADLRLDGDPRSAAGRRVALGEGLVNGDTTLVVTASEWEDQRGAVYLLTAP